MENNVALVEDSAHHKSQSPTSSLTQQQQQQQQTATTSSHAGSELVHTTATTVSLPPLGPSVLSPNNSNAVVGNGAGETTTTHHQAHGYGGIANAQPSPSPSPPPSTSTHHSSNSHHHQSQHSNNNQQPPPQFLQQPITFIFERFCSNVPPQALSLHTPLPSPQMVVRSVLDSPMDVLDANNKSLQQQPHINNPSLAPTTTTFHHHPYPFQGHHTPSNTSGSSVSSINSNGSKKSSNKKKRKQPHPQLQTQQTTQPQYSYKTPIESPSSMHTHDDSRSEEEYGDNLLTESPTRCEDYDMLTPVESLKRLLMQFPAMTPARLNTILPILLDNDIDDPEILLLIENDKFLRELRGKNGSDISLGNCLLLWHGIQEHQRMNNASAVHTPKSFSSSSSASYSPPPSSSLLRTTDLMLLSHPVPRAKRPKLELGDKDDSASSTISVSSQELDHHHHHHHHHHNIHENLVHKPTMQQQQHHHHHQQHHQSLLSNHHSNSSNCTTGNNSSGVNKQRVKAPKLSMSTIEEVHSRVDCVLRVVTHENERRKQIAISRNPQAQATLKFEDFVAELKQQHKIPVAFGTLRDMRFAYILKKLHELKYRELLVSNRGNVTEFYRTCQEVCEEIFEEEQLEAALPWLALKSKLYYK